MQLVGRRETASESSVCGWRKKMRFGFLGGETGYCLFETVLGSLNKEIAVLGGHGLADG